MARRGLQWGAAAALATLATVAGAAVAAAACGDTSVALLQGQWQYRETVHYTGTAVSAFQRFPEGHTDSGTLFFTSTCAGPGSCSVALSATADPTSQIASPNTALYSAGSQYPAVQSGSSYSVVIPSGGYGGPNLPPCRPPSLATTLRMTVVAARSAGGSWVATYVTGSEESLDGWTCSGSTGIATGYENVVFEAVPVGLPFPASDAAACGLEATPEALPAASGGSGGGLSVSTISSGLATPADAFGSVTQVAENALITLGVVLLITFPASLFNKTFEENYDDIRAIVRRRVRWLRGWGREGDTVADRRRDAAVFAVVVVAGAIIGGLNDPHFGFSTSSLLTFAGVVIAVLVGAGVSTAVGWAYRRARHLSTAARLHALPAGLVVAAACVVVSRLTSFQPGYLYGLIAGVAFSAALGADDTGRSIAIGAVATMLVGVAAWLVWVPAHEAAQTAGASGLTIVVADVLSSMFVGGLVGTVLSLVPLAFLPGGTLFHWRRRVWAILFGVAVFGLTCVMLRPESSSAHRGTTAVWTAAVLFVLFGAVSVGFRVYFTRRRRLRAAVA